MSPIVGRTLLLDVYNGMKKDHPNKISLSLEWVFCGFSLHHRAVSPLWNVDQSTIFRNIPSICGDVKRLAHETLFIYIFVQTAPEPNLLQKSHFYYLFCHLQKHPELFMDIIVIVQQYFCCGTLFASNRCDISTEYRLFCFVVTPDMWDNIH